MLKVLLSLLLLLPLVGKADSVETMSQSIGGLNNVYGPSVIYDRQEGIYKMWFMGWLNDGEQHDRIYYTTSVDGINWDAIQVVISPDWMNSMLGNEVDVYVWHTGDPSVTKHLNTANGLYQYTMFFTVCKNSCVENSTYNDNEIWSAVSSDGIHWNNPIMLLRSDIGPAEPSAIINESGNVFWKVYYADRLEPYVIKMASVDGNRNATAVQSVYTHSGPGVASGPEVRNINGVWSLFFNTHTGTNANGDYHIDIHKATSTTNDYWASSAVLISNGFEPYQGCATSTPGVLAFENGDPIPSYDYLLYFGYVDRRADGVCDNTKHHSIQRWQWNTN